MTGLFRQSLISGNQDVCRFSSSLYFTSYHSYTGGGNSVGLGAAVWSLGQTRKGVVLQIHGHSVEVDGESKFDDLGNK